MKFSLQECRLKNGYQKAVHTGYMMQKENGNPGILLKKSRKLPGHSLKKKTSMHQRETIIGLSGRIAEISVLSDMIYT